MERRVQTVCLVTLTVLAVAAALKWLAPVLVPFTMALFIAVVLRPLVQVQERWLRLPRVAALVSTLLFGLVLLGLLATLVSASIAELAANADLYATQLAKLVDRVVNVLPTTVGEIDVEAQIRELAQLPLKQIGGLLLGTTNAVANLLSKSTLVLVFVLFLLLGGGGGEATGVWREGEQRVERFLVMKVAISAVTGFLVGTTLYVLGVDLALVFGLFAFMLNFIPSVGSLVATLLPVPVVLMNPELSTAAAGLAIGIPAAIQLTIGQFMEPRIMGDELDLHPVTVILTLIVWGMLWGIVGMLLATPITAVMKILLERFEGTRILADLLAGRLDALRSPDPTPST